MYTYLITSGSYSDYRVVAIVQSPLGDLDFDNLWQEFLNDFKKGEEEFFRWNRYDLWDVSKMTEARYLAWMQSRPWLVVEAWDFRDFAPRQSFVNWLAHVKDIYEIDYTEVEIPED